MKKWMYNALILFFGAVLLISAGFLAHYYISAYIQQNRYQSLSALRGEVTTPRPTIYEGDESLDATLPAPTAPELVNVTNPDTGETISVLPEFAKLYELNGDLAGWISVPGTDIDYPVMQTPDSPNYYLKRNFDKNNSAHGCIYAQENCSLVAPSDNITLYGHRMKDRSMFAQLDNYMEESFFQENPYIYFDTLTQLHTYKIVSVFLTSASVGKGFAYNQFVTATDASEFANYISTCKDLALYDTGVDATYGDKLITLSTCEYSQTNGRLVIVAKRIA